MKVLMGFKTAEQGEQVCQLIRALDFPELELKASYVAEVLGSGISGLDASPFNYEAYLKCVENYAHLGLENLQLKARDMGLTNVTASILYGNIVNELLDQCDAQSVDILALGTPSPRRIENLLAGSVVRKAVANARSSLLISKGPVPQGKRLSVVLATDHSPHSKRWISRLLDWQPRGIREMTILSVLPQKLLEPLPASFNHLDVSQWIQEGMETENQQVIDKLAALDIPCRGLVKVGAVNDQLEEVMAHAKADLLIVGSQGHGFVERMTIGSTSLEQAVKRPYSVLVVRA